MPAEPGSKRTPETGAFFQRDRTWHPPALTPGYKTSVLRSPQKALLSFDNTLSEITGPVFGHAMLGELDDDLIHNFAKPGESAIGQRTIVYGRVLDERGKGVAGALLEVWQANAGGRYRHKKDSYLAALDPNFGGCGRTITGEDGSYAFRTVKPGAYPWPNGAERLAAGAHPFLHLRPRLRAAAHHPDVFRRRSADLAMPDRARHPRQGRDRDADRRAGHAGDDPDGRARLQIRHRAARTPLVNVREQAGGQLMTQSLDRLKETPSQTAGPYVHIGLTPNFCGIGGVDGEDLGTTMVNERTKGERIALNIRVIDGGGTPLRDALIEIWQADADGLYNSPAETRGTADPNFAGWGRCPSDMETGDCVFHTIKPGRVPFGGGRLMAPHVSLWIVARGINVGLHTRLYFSDEQAANAEDPILARIEHRNRVPTLIAERTDGGYVFDIHLQGDRETVFFDS